MRAGGAFFGGFGVGLGRVFQRQIAFGFGKAQLRKAGGKVFGQRRDDIQRITFGMRDDQSPCVQMHLAADRSGQECALTAIFAITHDRMPDRRHVYA